MSDSAAVEKAPAAKAAKKSGAKPDASAAGGAGGDAGKKGAKKTGLALSATKEGDFAEWYTQAIVMSEMIEYYDVSGCYILRPWAFRIWETIQAFFDKEIKDLGVENAYFPVFVTKKALEAEADHVEGFAPEVAWVTHSGQSALPEPVAIRPTSETIMYPAYAKWIRSHRDLPVRLNQWTNVVRWEFKHPTPFLRTREFLWQEGHSAFRTREDADKEVLEILDLYARVYEELLAVPVIKGRKSEKEKFAGGLYTTTVEGFIPANGRAIQGATSHCLGQNFSKIFDIKFIDKDDQTKYAWQNSWGLTTRTIGVCVMVHGDNKGLVLPPRVAPLQVVIVFIYASADGPEVVETLSDTCKGIERSLKAAGVRVKIDDRDNYAPGWKYAHWEQKGVPLRIEVGPKDLAKAQVMVARRDTGAKFAVPLADVGEAIPDLLATVQQDMLTKARKERDEKLAVITEWAEFVPSLDRRNIVLAPWCERIVCEDEVKARTKGDAVPDSKAAAGGEEAAGEDAAPKGLTGAAKTLCIPFEQAEMSEGQKCFCCGEPAVSWTLWGRSY